MAKLWCFLVILTKNSLLVAKVQKSLRTLEALAVQHEKIERICWDKSGKGACEAGKKREPPTQRLLPSLGGFTTRE